MRTIAIVLILSLSPAAAAAGDCTKQIYSNPKAEPDYGCPGPGEDAMVPRLQLKTSVDLKLNEKAPWPGVLMGKNRVLTLGLRIKGLRRLRWQENIKHQEEMEAEKKFQASMFNATINLRTSQRDNYKKQNVALKEEIVRLNRWYRSPTFWFVTGVVVTSAAATALAFGLRK